MRSVRNWWRRKRSLTNELHEEISFHLDMRAQLNRESGMAGREAVQAAHRHFGNTTLIQEDMRRMHRNTFLESLIQDLRYAARGFVRSPVFTLTAVFAAALGIGASTAVFSVVDRILFRSLPYPQADRLVSVGIASPLDRNEFLFPEAYFPWRAYQKSFQAITSWTAGVAACDLSEINPVRLDCARVEATFLPTLGITPFLGRNFTAGEDRPNAPRVAMLSYGLWQTRFGRNPNLVGKQILLDGQPFTITGILPPSFEMPTLNHADLLIPQALSDTERNGRALRVFARLKDGVTLEQAEAAMQPLFQQSLKSVPAPFRSEMRLRIRSLRDRQIQDARLASWVLLAAVAAVLLIACANIANLLLARSLYRQREMAVRTALGAGRLRLIRQIITESLLLSVIGGIAGCAVASVLLRTFVGIAPDGIPRLAQAALDTRVLLVTFVGSLVCGLFFGLAPALQTPRAESLAGWRTTGTRRLLLRETLVAAQLAVSLVLLTGAGMLLRSLWNLENISLGIETEHVITAEFVLGKQAYSKPEQQLAFFEQLEPRLRQLGYLGPIALSDSLPPSGPSRSRPLAAIHVDGRPPLAEGSGGMVTWRFVTPGYFPALGIPILHGRGFVEQDRASNENFVILSQSLATKLFAHDDALGKRIRTESPATVIGIARDVNIGDHTEPEYYVLRKHILDATFNNQMPPNGWRRASIAIRTPLNPKETMGWIRREVASIDPVLPVTIATMQERVSGLTQRPRFIATLLSLFAGMGILLAAIGIYGVMAFLVGQRTQEIGVRMALGATPAVIGKLILARAALWTLAGATIGLAGSLLATRTLGTLLFNVPPNDPATLAAATTLLLLISFGAAWIPSRKAASVDPMVALRHD
jgi:putative ABC transport system permease protein